MGTPWRDHCQDTPIFVLSAVTSALTPTGVGISVQWKCHHHLAVIISHAHNLFTSNKYSLWSTAHWEEWKAVQRQEYVNYSNYHSDVVVCTTLETSLNDLGLWCIGSCVGCYHRPMTTSSELHCHRCLHTLWWYCCVLGHSCCRGWAIHILSTHRNSEER